MKLEIVKAPSEILTTRCSLVDKFDDNLLDLMDSMVETAIHSNGIGLAAPQIGITQRFLVAFNSVSFQYVINPTILWYSPEVVTMEEGCLSIPGKTVPVTRSKVISIEYIDHRFTVRRTLAFDLFARVLQHECDHLDGKIIA